VRGFDSVDAIAMMAIASSWNDGRPIGPMACGGSQPFVDVGDFDERRRSWKKSLGDLTPEATWL